MSLARCDVVPHVVIQSSHLRLGEFESYAAKRLLQTISALNELFDSQIAINGQVLRANGGII